MEPDPDAALDLDRTRLPHHVAIVMDGNGRWAQRQGLPRTAGHAAGEEALYRVVDAAIDLGLPWLTVYGFSTENWVRPADEVSYLMGLPGEVVARRMAELHERNVRVRVAGRRDDRVPAAVLDHIDGAVTRTAGNTGLTFCIAFNYGGRAEIVDAARAIAALGVSPEEIDEDLFGRHLYMPDMPDPDVLIRTSGETRLSNFLLWELAYTELVFTDVLWPDFNGADLVDAIAEYQRRERRYGGVARP